MAGFFIACKPVKANFKLLPEKKKPADACLFLFPFLLLILDYFVIPEKGSFNKKARWRVLVFISSLRKLKQAWFAVVGNKKPDF